MLAQAHARLVFRAEVTMQDAIYAVFLMEASSSGTGLIGQLSPLHSEHIADPEGEYKELESLLLTKLRLDAEGHELRNDAAPPPHAFFDQFSAGGGGGGAG